MQKNTFQEKRPVVGKAQNYQKVTLNRSRGQEGAQQTLQTDPAAPRAMDCRKLPPGAHQQDPTWKLILVAQIP